LFSIKAEIWMRVTFLFDFYFFNAQLGFYTEGVLRAQNEREALYLLFHKLLNRHYFPFGNDV
jgi:hypothetical protein